MSKLASNLGHNPFFSIDDLPLTNDQKEMVLEWFARKLWKIVEDGIYGDGGYYGKSYDPLVIECNTAHSYVFNLSESGHGGRHHEFETLKQLEDRLMREVLTDAKALCGGCEGGEV